MVGRRAEVASAKTAVSARMRGMAADAAAKELIQLAKNRLNKFYSPKL